ncbi:hypothetical protein SAMN05518846_10567 [Brevibacillus centrosporus]|uniref:Uncharacterized protein n=1 Tax=Brevibacillus centrosporus TaxID=54910 RepID=A0A1I3TUW2_9BACL|nr:hypothetical protein SAMN05518846_10567 [Brevibacillus centrosporus]
MALAYPYLAALGWPASGSAALDWLASGLEALGWLASGLEALDWLASGSVYWEATDSAWAGSVFAALVEVA